MVAITVAPPASASCRAKRETPPVPWTRTVEPGTRRWEGEEYSAFQAVTAAQGRVAACA